MDEGVKIGSYEEWEASVPTLIKEDSLWKMQAYRKALFLGDLAWFDLQKLNQHRWLWSLSDQLYRATGSMSANLAEGYSKGTGKDRARFYEYSLGSARESRDWYFKARYMPGEEVFNHRLGLLTDLIRLLLVMVPHQRQQILREDAISYTSSEDDLP